MDNTITLYKWILQVFTVEAREGSVAKLKPHLSAHFHPGAEVLDLCCGAGPASFWFEEMGARVTAMDFAPYMIELARAEARTRCSSVNFVQADIFAADFGCDRFDLVTCLGNSITDFPLASFAALVEKVSRALKPGGRFAVQYQDESWPFFQGSAATSSVYQEEPERVTFRLERYLPELAATERIWNNETLGEEYHRIGYIYTVPAVQLAANRSLVLEQHVSLAENHFLDVFAKPGAAPGH